MLDLILKKIFERLLEALEKILKKEDAAKKCIESGQFLSQAMRELLKMDPDLRLAKSLIRKAEKLCDENLEELLQAKRYIESIELANREAIKSEKEVKRAVAAKNKAKAALAKAKAVRAKAVQAKVDSKNRIAAKNVAAKVGKAASAKAGKPKKAVVKKSGTKNVSRKKGCS